MIVVRLALRSLRNRWLTAALTVFAIAVSIMLLLGVEKVRSGARQSFADTISGSGTIQAMSATEAMSCRLAQVMLFVALPIRKTE